MLQKKVPLEVIEYMCLNISVFYHLLLRLQNLFFKEKPKKCEILVSSCAFPLIQGQNDGNFIFFYSIYMVSI